MSQASAFDQLVAAAAAQSQPQLLLFVFAGAELPADATPAQRASFDAGVGGELTPLMCVEKRLDELSTFDALVEESRGVGPPWQVVFAAGLGGKEGQPPTPKATSDALRSMVERVRNGAVDAFLALSTRGEHLSFT
jgi:hypothetical protein